MPAASVVQFPPVAVPHAARPRLVATTHSWKEWNKVQSVWSEIYQAAHWRSLFLDSNWVGAWLEVYGPILHPTILMFHFGPQPVGGCVLVHRFSQHFGLPLRRAYLNTSGEDSADSACVEFTAVLSVRGAESEVIRALLDHLSQSAWDELQLPGCMEGFCDLFAQNLDMQWNKKAVTSPFVDLAGLRAKSVSYDSALTSNTRQQIRRSIKLYEANGPLHLDLANSVDEALSFFDNLSLLHQQSWTARGQAGSFSSRPFVAFHRNLISRSFPEGAHLLRISAGQQPIGYLYNLVEPSAVYFYQSGLSYDTDNRLKPGLVSHFLAVQHYLQQGYGYYHFMAGEEKYKRSLGPELTYIESLTVERRSFKMAAVRLARKARAWTRQVRETRGNS